MKEIKWSLPLTEQANLLIALQRNCNCSYGEGGIRTSCCPSHAMLTTQDSVNHLQYGRTLRDKIMDEEGTR